MALEKELKKAPPKSFKRHLTGLRSLRTSFLSFAIGVRKHKKAEARPRFDLSVGFNQPVFTIFPTVYDAGTIGFSIFKDEEVVSQHVHLQDCFFAVHRFQ